MLAISTFGSCVDDRIKLGARWVLTALQQAASARGLHLTNCRWLEDDDSEGEDRYVLTFDSGGVENWEPFEAADLEDLSGSARVMRSIETQLQQLLTRVAGTTPEASGVGPDQRPTPI